jgi:hypothetical protein
MSSWGYTDNAALTGTITGYTANVNVVGSGTAFTTEVDGGNYLVIGGQKYQVNNVTSATALTLTSVLSSATSGATAYLQQGPKFLSNVNAQLSNGRQNDLSTIQNVYGVDLSEMGTKQVKTATVTAAGAGYSAAAQSNTTATVLTIGAVLPEINATATVNYTGSTVANVIINNFGAGYTTAVQSNTSLVIATTGSVQPTTNATASLTFTSTTESSNASHTGWNFYLTYVDAYGNTRKKNEVLVAMSKSFTAGTAGDASDDTIFRDS